MSTLEKLPIDAHLNALVSSLRSSGTLVFSADPGSGKTTRLPPAIMQETGGGQVLVLEPRRIAARLAAERVAAEISRSTGTPESPGDLVGFQTRTHSKVTKQTRLIYMTEGTLLRRLSRDRLLRGVNAVVLDEFHERHLQSDAALALLIALRAGARPDLWLTVMSATLDTKRLEKHLGTRAMHIEAKMHPVDISFERTQDRRPLEERVRSACLKIHADHGARDTLVFLPGAGEIRKCERVLRDHAKRRGIDIFSLHGSQSKKAQDEAICGRGHPRIILSTNIAESSVTLGGVSAVIDSGLARRAGIDPKCGLPSLDLRPVSKASAIQRAGRAGRQGPGIVMRLYSKFDFERRPAFDTPDILRSDLSELALMATHMGSALSALPFLDRPSDQAIHEALALLSVLQAMEGTHITSLGHAMAQLPTHPRFARGLLALSNLSEEAALLVAIMEDMRAFESHGKRPASSHRSDLVSAVDSVLLGEPAHHVQKSLKKRATTLERATRRVNKDAKHACIDDEQSIDEQLMRALMLMFPDRIAMRRTHKSERLLLCTGSEATLSKSSGVRTDDFIVCPFVHQGTGNSPVVSHASAVEPEWLLEYFSDRITTSRGLRYDDTEGRVLARDALCFGALTLDASERPAEPSAETTDVLLAHAKRIGLENILDKDASHALYCRLRFAKAEGYQGLGTDESLEDFESFLEKAFRALLGDATGLRAISERPLSDALHMMLNNYEARDFERFAPTFISLPGRKKAPVTYKEDGEPFVSSRLQDFIGLTDTPCIAGGRVPLVLHLLAPNRRAVQVTKDLRGFFRNHYPGLRKTLMRRYPKHPWPEPEQT